MKRIYLDHNATTPILPEVKEAVIPFIGEMFGNPSSRYKEGREVKTAIEKTRESIARIINVPTERLFFTSSATEANNTVLRGYYINYREKKEKNHIIISAVEHPSVITTAKKLAKEGFELTILPVDTKGRINIEDIKRSIKGNTGLISIMMANNEIGNIYPVKEIAEIAKDNGILTHTDAVQAVGKMDVDAVDLGVDFLTFSGHKFYGLKGAGALYMKKGRGTVQFISGGHQESGKRAGTENVAGIIAMGKALEVVTKDISSETERVGTLRDLLQKRITEEIPYVNVLGDTENRLYTTTNVSFKFIEGEGILLKLDYNGVAASTGSACSSGSLDPSHVITSMNVSHDEAHSTIRFSLGRSTTEDDINYTVDKLKGIIETLRSFSPLYDEFLEKNK